MALQKFRDKQKLIYWIVAIIVIPSFMIFGYSQVFDYNPERSTVGIVDKKPYSYQDFSDFYQRIQAVNFGQPVYLTMDGQTPWLQDSDAMFIILALRDKALKYGLLVTDEEVATYIKGQFGYQGESEKELEGLIEKMIQRTSRLKGVYEYKLGVHDWLLVKKFLNVLDNSIFFPESFAAITNTMQKTAITYGELDIPVADFNKAAQAEFNNLSETELKSRAKEFITEFQQPAYRRLYPFLWTDARWKFEFISVPLVVDALEPEINDEIIQNYYTDNKDRYKDSEGKEQDFEAVKDKVTEDYTNSYRVQTAQNTFGNEFNRFLGRVALKVDTAENADNDLNKVPLADIAADQQLKDRGVTTGITGSELLTAFEIANNESFTGSGIQYFLNKLDNDLQQAKETDKQNKNDEASKKLLDEYSRTFKGFSQFGMEIPFSSKDKILSKVRLVDYTPGVTRKLSDKDGVELLEQIKAAMIENTADKLAKTAAEKAKTALKEHKDEVDGQKVTTNEASFSSLYNEQNGKLSALGLTAVNDTFGPVFNPTTSSYNIYVVYKRDTDSLAGQSAKPVTADVLSTYYRGNSEYQPEFQMPAAIKVGARLSAYLLDQSDNIKFNIKN